MRGAPSKLIQPASSAEASITAMCTRIPSSLARATAASSMRWIASTVSVARGAETCIGRAPVVASAAPRLELDVELGERAQREAGNVARARAPGREPEAFEALEQRAEGQVELEAGERSAQAVVR